MNGLQTFIFERLFHFNMWKEARPSYTPPTGKRLRTSLLENRYVRLKRLVDIKIALAKNIVITTDGWSNLRGDHLVIFVVIIPGVQRPIFYKAIDCKGIRQTSENIAIEITNVIESLRGSKKVSALNCTVW